MRSSTFTLLVLGLVASVWTGCVNLKPLADTTRFYTLAPANPAPAAVQAGAIRVGVRVSLLSEYLRHPPIAVRVSANELRFSDDQRWAEQLDEGVERALVAALQSRLPDAAVAPTSNGVAAGAPVTITVAISSCEGTADGSAVLEGHWLIRGKDIEPAAAGAFRRTRTGWDGANYGQLAGLLGGLVDELAAELAPAVSANL